MNEKKKLQPKVRFREFTGENAPDWEQRKFRELLDKEDGIRRGPFGSAIKKEFFVAESDYVVYEQYNAIYNKFKTRYNINKEKYIELIKFCINPGDFLLSGAGTIGKIARVPEGIKKGIFNQALVRIKINPSTTDSEYFLQWMRSVNMQKKLTQMNPGSAMSNLVPMAEVKEWSIYIPSRVEQNYIGKLFEKLDELITLHQRKLEQLEQLKNTLLSKMFPKSGTNIPEIRFSGFTDAWKQRKLGEVVNITMGQSPNSENYTENPDDNILVQGNADLKNGRVFPRVWTTQITKTAEKGDLILSVRAPVGSVGKTDYDVVLGRGVAGIKGNEFIFQMLGKMNIDGYWNKYSTGSTFESINSNDIIDAQIVLPKEDEQIKLGIFLHQLDEIITIHQRKLEQLKNLKQTLLNKMFI
ncbi:restriction endonuclease subunit S [Enterococcus cecorum]|uniref:restriction endonuclease subunit S n=1 Tax=Enterococcus cecorum TaxID=44008 RepID=UPI002ACADBD6|nr:restriction endonuclease subunit S [Enterococcus cecorum]MDZ5557547.1 restriction endonuclease subunit S [Enterococcus cecorum]